jgi:hypothetical protein
MGNRSNRDNSTDQTEDQRAGEVKDAEDGATVHDENDTNADLAEGSSDVGEQGHDDNIGAIFVKNDGERTPNGGPVYGVVVGTETETDEQGNEVERTYIARLETEVFDESVWDKRND